MNAALFLLKMRFNIPWSVTRTNHNLIDGILTLSILEQDLQGLEHGTPQIGLRIDLDGQTDPVGWKTWTFKKHQHGNGTHVSDQCARKVNIWWTQPSDLRNRMRKILQDALDGAWWQGKRWTGRPCLDEDRGGRAAERWRFFRWLHVYSYSNVGNVLIFISIYIYICSTLILILIWIYALTCA